MSSSVFTIKFGLSERRRRSIAEERWKNRGGWGEGRLLALVQSPTSFFELTLKRALLTGETLKTGKARSYL